jgi:phage shock protein A
VSQQIKQLEDRISRLESDLAQLRQVVATLKPAEPEAKRGPGRPKKAE